jgi:NitT/TauT family transport system substrate-binding protein
MIMTHGTQNSDDADEKAPAETQPVISRRAILTGAGAVALAAPFVLSARGSVAGPIPPFPTGLPDSAVCRVADSVAATGPLKKVSLAWNAGAACLVGITTTKEKGIFAKHGLDVELVNFSGSTDQLLETIATGKADAAVGMALRWLKPLEGGFDVKIVGSTHGGCLRLLVPATSDIKKLEDLKGKTVAVSDMNSPSKNFFSVRLKKAGLDPEKDVDFRPFPLPLLRTAVEKGEAHALAENDPMPYIWLKDGQFVEISSNLTDEYASRVCCLIGVRGTTLREDKSTAAAIVRALVEGASYAHQNPEEAAATYVPYTAGKTTVEDVTNLAKYHTHGHHPNGAELKKELALYAEELKLVNVLKPSTDISRFVDRIYADVVS